MDNTGKVTNAMSLIAASKMRRAQNSVLQGRPYAEKIYEVIAHLAAQPSEDGGALHPLLEVRDVNRIGLLAITPDRGLAGGMHSNINRRVAQFILNQEAPTRSIAVGRKGRDFMARYGQDLLAVFADLGDQPMVVDTLPISRMLIDNFLAAEMDEVYIVYTKFISTMNQEPVVEKLLPVTPAELSAADRSGFIYEPDTMTVLGSLLPQFVDMQVYHAMLESIASEQSARMVAMRNATDNAKALADDLTLVMNKLRQDSITNELLDLVGGQVALEG